MIEFSIIWLLYSAYFLLDLINNKVPGSDNKVNLVVIDRSEEFEIEEIDKTAFDIFVYGSFQLFFTIFILFDAYFWINL